MVSGERKRQRAKERKKRAVTRHSRCSCRPLPGQSGRWIRAASSGLRYALPSRAGCITALADICGKRFFAALRMTDVGRRLSSAASEWLQKDQKQNHEQERADDAVNDGELAARRGSR